MLELSMAYKRKVAKIQIRDTAVGKMRDHIGYLLLYPATVDRHKWATELVSPFSALRSYLNLKEGKFSKSDMFELLYEEPLGDERQRHQLLTRCIIHMKGATPTGSLEHIKLFYKLMTEFIMSRKPIDYKTIESLFEVVEERPQ